MFKLKKSVSSEGQLKYTSKATTWLTSGPVCTCVWAHKKPVRSWMKSSCWWWPHLCIPRSAACTTAPKPWWQPCPTVQQTLRAKWGGFGEDEPEEGGMETKCRCRIWPWTAAPQLRPVSLFYHTDRCRVSGTSRWSVSALITLIDTGTYSLTGGKQNSGRKVNNEIKFL